MSELKKIEAPALSPTYGNDINETFNNIQENFDVLANQELYRGEPGTNLITVNLSWKTVFGTTEGNPIEVRVGSVEPKTYYILNFGPIIRSGLNDLSQDSEVDTTAAINGLRNSGSITVCFADVETTSDAPTQVLSAIPFVFIDMRFRSTADYSRLDNRTDMSCVIMYADGWKCTQSFPTLYYNEGNLYWKINGQNTSILAQGPAGKDGSTGTVYVGLSDDLKINTVLGTTGTTAVDIKYLLQYQIISQDSEGYNELTDTSHLPFVTIADWVNINESNPINGAPVIVMGEDQPPVTHNDDNLGVPYYISELIYNELGTCTCNVSKYNICYAHMNDSTVKLALQKNVLFRAADPDDEGDNELKGVSIKERGAGTGGYSIFVPFNTAITNLKEFTFAYVDNIDDPKTNYTNQSSNTYKGRFRFVGGMTVGLAINSEITASEKGACAEGYAADDSTIEASGEGSHAEGYSNDRSEIKASGEGSHAEGYSDAQSTIYATNDGSHAEGYVGHSGNIESSGMGSHAEGYSVDQSTIYATSHGSHAEGYVDGTNHYIKASGEGSHAEGYAYDGNIVASGVGAHAEGINTTALGNGSHAEGDSTKAIENYSHAEGDSTKAIETASHAEGFLTTASGTASHAEGHDTTASGDYSHAEGVFTTASGIASHAEGYNTTASGAHSHTAGSNTTASLADAAAFGKYNAEGTDVYLYQGVGGDIILGKNVGGGLIYAVDKNGSNDVFSRISNMRIVFSVGIGKRLDDNNQDYRQNAFMIFEDGSMCCYSSKRGHGGIATGTTASTRTRDVTFYKRI